MRINWKAAGLALLTVGIGVGVAVLLAVGGPWSGVVLCLAVARLLYWAWGDLLAEEDEEGEADDAD